MDAPIPPVNAAAPISAWLVRPTLKSEATARLICLPFAGGGAAAFYPWQSLLPPWIELTLVQLPGREQRLREQPINRMASAVAAITAELAGLVDCPYALFGHSMGALIAFEVARALRAAGAPPPACLFVSGRRAPQIVDPEPPIHALADGPFVGALIRRYNAIPRPLLEDIDLLRLFLPALRADVELLETYSYTPAAPLESPIIAMGGNDDSRAQYGDLAAWQSQSNAPLQIHQFAGGHFYINTARESLLAMLVDVLDDNVHPRTATAHERNDR